MTWLVWMLLKINVLAGTVDAKPREDTRRMIKKVVAIILLLFFTCACANQAVILSEPAGATVFVNGEEIGTTPCKFDYQCSTGTSYQVAVQKDGYEMMQHQFKADEVDQQARKKWLAAGLVWSPLWIGTLFTKKLKDSYEFVLKKAEPIFSAEAKIDNKDTHF